MPKKDLNQVAFDVVRHAAGEVPPEKPKALAGRKGGRIGGKRRAAALTPEQRRQIARKAAKARWRKP